MVLIPIVPFPAGSGRPIPFPPGVFTGVFTGVLAGGRGGNYYITGDKNQRESFKDLFALLEDGPESVEAFLHSERDCR
jgi:hypothetical protein